VPKIQSEEVASETPRSSMSEPASMSSPPQPEDRQSPSDSLPNIERPKSASDEHLKEHHEAWYPRRLSFSMAQDAVETWYTSPGP
jgi:hypothetical protein